MPAEYAFAGEAEEQLCYIIYRLFPILIAQLKEYSEQCFILGL